MLVVGERASHGIPQERYDLGVREHSCRARSRVGTEHVVRRALERGQGPPERCEDRLLDDGREVGAVPELAARKLLGEEADFFPQRRYDVRVASEILVERAGSAAHGPDEQRLREHAKRGGRQACLEASFDQPDAIFQRNPRLDGVDCVEPAQHSRTPPSQDVLCRGRANLRPHQMMPRARSSMLTQSALCSTEPSTVSTTSSGADGGS